MTKTTATSARMPRNVKKQQNKSSMTLHGFNYEK